MFTYLYYPDIIQTTNNAAVMMAELRSNGWSDLTLLLPSVEVKQWCEKNEGICLVFDVADYEMLFLQSNEGILLDVETGKILGVNFNVYI